MDNSKHIIVKSILIPLGAVYLKNVEGDIINYNKYKNYLVYFDTIDRVVSFHEYFKLYDSKIILVYQNNNNVNVVALKTIDNRKLLFVYSFKKIKDVTKEVVARKRKEKRKKRNEWSTIKIKSEIKKKLDELKESYGFSSFNELINNLLLCKYTEIEKENKELLETINEIFNV